MIVTTERGDCLLGAVLVPLLPHSEVTAPVLLHRARPGLHEHGQIDDVEVGGDVGDRRPPGPVRRLPAHPHVGPWAAPRRSTARLPPPRAARPGAAAAARGGGPSKTAAASAPTAAGAGSAAASSRRPLSVTSNSRAQDAEAPGCDGPPSVSGISTAPHPGQLSVVRGDWWAVGARWCRTAPGGGEEGWIEGSVRNQRPVRGSMIAVRTRAAVLRRPETEYEIVELEVLDPGPGEVLVEVAYAGLCHSDEHLRHSNPGGRYPIVGGHEG